jgi:hypothetical protein
MSISRQLVFGFSLPARGVLEPDGPVDRRADLRGLRSDAFFVRMEAARALLISVNRSAADASLYEATRYAWKLSLPRPNAPK